MSGPQLQSPRGLRPPGPDPGPPTGHHLRAVLEDIDELLLTIARRDLQLRQLAAALAQRGRPGE